jgi:hypothetical protein
MQKNVLQTLINQIVLRMLSQRGNFAKIKIRTEIEKLQFFGKIPFGYPGIRTKLEFSVSFSAFSF